MGLRRARTQRPPWAPRCCATRKSGRRWPSKPPRPLGGATASARPGRPPASRSGPRHAHQNMGGSEQRTSGVPTVSGFLAGQAQSAARWGLRYGRWQTGHSHRKSALRRGRGFIRGPKVGVSRRQVYRTVVFPAIIRELVGGIRVAVGVSRAFKLLQNRWARSKEWGRYFRWLCRCRHWT
jgi:hypothetical protein